MSAHKECLEHIADTLKRESKERTGPIADAAELFSWRIRAEAADAPSVPKDIERERFAVREFLSRRLAGDIEDLLMGAQQHGLYAEKQAWKFIPEIVERAMQDLTKRQDHRRGDSMKATESK